MNHLAIESKCRRCSATYKNHSWGRTAAHKEGWFFAKDGRSWCPKHQPEWVAKWRKERLDKEQRP